MTFDTPLSSGTRPRTYIIAEAGVNHNGFLELARDLARMAKAAGADAVKFQTFRASALVSRAAPKAAYQRRTTPASESQREMIANLELDLAAHHALHALCRELEIDFLSSPFDVQSLDLLTDLGVETLKIPSGEITNAPFLVEVGGRRRRVILSTGMSTLGEIENALGMIALGLLGSADVSLGAARRCYASDEGQRALRQFVTLLHCTTEYPAPFGEVNLQVMTTLSRAFGLPVGYSDHTPGHAVTVAAAALGAVVIEKHLTLDRTLPGPDQRASLEPDAFAELVTAVRQTEAALGTGVKRPTPSEAQNIHVARKSLVAAAPIARGEPFTAHNLTAKRPGCGVSPMHWSEFLGRAAERDYEADELIDEPLIAADKPLAETILRRDPLNGGRRSA